MKDAYRLLKRFRNSPWFWMGILVFLTVIATPTYYFMKIHPDSKPSSSLPTKLGPAYSWTQIRQMESHAVVKIKTFTSGMGVPGTDSSGTGWLTKKGYIVTCYHVLSDKNYIINVYPYLNGHNQYDKVWYRAKVIHTDEQTDLAVLKIVQQQAPLTSGLAQAHGAYVSGNSNLVLGYSGGHTLTSFVACTGLPQFLSQQSALVYSITGINSMEISGLCGSPVLNASGKVIGILDAQHSNGQEYVYMIPARDLSNWHVN